MFGRSRHPPRQPVLTTPRGAREGTGLCPLPAEAVRRAAAIQRRRSEEALRRRAAELAALAKVMAGLPPPVNEAMRSILYFAVGSPVLEGEQQRAQGVGAGVGVADAVGRGGGGVGVAGASARVLGGRPRGRLAGGAPALRPERAEAALVGRGWLAVFIGKE